MMYTSEHCNAGDPFYPVGSRHKKAPGCFDAPLEAVESFLAVEAIARFVEVEEWQLDEIRAGMADLNTGHSVTHEKVTRWLKSWGTPAEGKPPR